MPSSTAYLVILYVILPVVTSERELCETDFGTESFLNILENVDRETVIGYVNITGDSSQITLSQEPHDYYSFNNITRNVTVVKEISTDVGDAEIPDLILKCQANTEGARATTLTVLIIVTDYNDNTPQFEHVHHNVSISEAANEGDIVYTGAIATDNDKQFDGNSRITYKIVPNQNHSDYFDILVPTKSTITVAKQLDYETMPVMSLLIEASDTPKQGKGVSLSSTATLTIHITDADDQKPVFTQISYRGSIRQDAQPNTAVATDHVISARDPDTMNVTVVYSIMDPYNLFTIDPFTGIIRNERPLFVDVPTITVVVLASQIDNKDQIGFTLLTISITAANINAPRFSQLVYKVTKTELEPIGSTLISTTATDPDFRTVTGTVITYAIVEQDTGLSIDDTGSIILMSLLDFEVEKERVVSITASDGSHTTTATVNITVLDVNDNNPVFDILSSYSVRKDRIQGDLVTIVSATDRDVENVLRYEIQTHNDLFTINSDGEIFIKATPEQITDEFYSLLVTVSDDGTPSRQSSLVIDVNFPPVGFTHAPTTTPEALAIAGAADDSMMIIIIGAVAGLLLVIILIMIVYIVWRHRRTKEELDRARAPKGYAAKGLTYRQAESPDDLPKMDLRYTDDTDGTSEFDGSTTVQENPLSDAAVNQGYLQSSGSEMDRDISEIEVETAVIPYDEGYGYQSENSDYHGQLRTFQPDDTTSSGSNVSDSTGGSRRVLVNEDNKNGPSKLTSWDSDDKIHPQGSQKLLDNNIIPNTRTKKEKPEITVYF